MISNTWNWVLEWTKDSGGTEVQRWGNSGVKKKYVYSIYHMIAQTLALLTRILPNFPSNEGFDVQIYWYIFRGDNGDSDTA